MKKIFIMALLFLSISQANATVWEFNRAQGGHHMAGVIKDYVIRYDTNGALSMHMNVESNADVDVPWYNPADQAERQGDMMTGGWLVLTSGGMPSNHEHAKIWMNFETGDAYAYEYVSSPRDSTPDASLHIATYHDVITKVDDGNGGFRIEMDLDDISAIENHVSSNTNNEWKGVAFDDTLGIWAHYYAIDEFESGNDVITHWRGDGSTYSYVDSNTTYAQEVDEPTSVSEPAGLAFVSILMMGAFIRRRVK